MTQWYRDNPAQIDIRSQAMKRTWASGNIQPNNISPNCESKIEREFRQMLASRLPDKEVGKQTIHVEGAWFYPDVSVDREVLIEFYGNYWHANPKMYKPDDVVNGMLASDIWKRDRERIAAIEQYNYEVIVVWESDFKKDKQGVIERLIPKIESTQAHLDERINS